MITKEQFALNLKKLCDATGKSQVEIANEIGTSDVMLNGWLHACNIPRIDTIEKLSNYFKVSPAYFLEDPNRRTQSFFLEKGEAEIVTLYRFSNGEGKQRIEEYVRFIASTYK